MKTCTKCGEVKPLNAFPAKGGLRCRACCAEYLRQYRVENKAALNEKQRAKYAAQPEEFRAKEKERNRKRHWANREKELERAKTYYARNRSTVAAKHRARHAQNPRRAAVKMANWRSKNPEKARLAKVAYYSRMKRATPWADRALMADIYRYARIMRAHGVDCHVDHQIPLRGKRVSGLHTHENLTVISAEQNLRKNSKYEVE